jgi:hypothetical protein
MVFLDNTLLAPREQRAFRPRLSAPLLIALAALVVGLCGYAWGGFDTGALAGGTQMVWRFSLLVFFAALVAGPLGRLTPFAWFAGKSRALLQGFCAVVGVHAAFILLPNLFAVPDGVQSNGVTAGATFFIVFTGSVALVMTAAVNRGLCERVGDKACRAMLGVSVIFFWLCFSLIGLAHITGPHKPDPFYELSVILMVAALLGRFADRFFAARNPAQPA